MSIATPLRAARGGFTIMEILVALGIFVVGMVSILSLFVVATSVHSSAVRKTDAALLAETVFAELEGDPRFVLGKGLPTLTDRTHPEYPDYRYDLTFSALDAAGAQVLCDLTVRWLERGKWRRRSFATICLRGLDPQQKVKTNP